MKEFQGFPARMEFTSIPNIFFSNLMPNISDISELKTTLHVLALLYRKKGHPRFVTFKELLADSALMSSLKETEKPTEEVLSGALKMATERGTLLHMVYDNTGAPEDVYLVNTESNRSVVARVEAGELKLSGLKAAGQTYVDTEKPPDIFSLYEQNIGMLTPLIADQLRDAENTYPPEWVRDAIKEAVNHGKRSWSYIAAILERWSVEGKGDGTYRRDSKKTDPDKYIKGKYGHMVRR